MPVIDVSDLDVHVLINALWKRSTQHRPPRSSEISHEQIAKHLANTKYINYIAGRGIKVSFRDLTKVNTFMYNRDMGPGTFEAVVAELRAT